MNLEDKNYFDNVYNKVVYEGMNMKLPYDIIVVYNQDGRTERKAIVKAYSEKQAVMIFLKNYPEYLNDNLFTVYARLQKAPKMPYSD